MATDNTPMITEHPRPYTATGTAFIRSASGVYREQAAAQGDPLSVSKKVLDKGHVELVAHCAEDLDVVNAARVSFAVAHDSLQEGDDKLVGFLMRERHGSPFEHTFFKFRVKAPIFVFREWQRHRVGHSYNEMSMRYVKIDPEFYIPDVVRARVGKPGSYFHHELGDKDKALNFINLLLTGNNKARKAYQEALDDGVAPEMARALLPVSTYSEMIWSCNARSLMHFLGLRNSDKALWEIQQFAQAAEYFFEQIMPITYKAFVANNRTAP